MTDKEKILVKIESLLNETNYEPFTNEVFGRIQSLKELKSYIDSLQEEPVSEGLEEAAYHNCIDRLSKESIEDFKAGAKWQKSEDAKLIINAKDDGYRLGLATMKQQMMKDATEVTVHIDAGGYPYIPQMELYDYDKDIPLAKGGDKYKVVLIKEE